MCQVNGKAEISTPHSSHIFQPILMKLKTKKDIRDTTQHAKFGWCGTTGRGLRREGIFRYFLCSFFVYLLTPTGHTRGPITTVYGSKRVFPRNVGPFEGLDDKNNVWRSKLLKNMILGAWIDILSQSCQIFESQYLEKYALDQHEIWRKISGAQMDFVGGPALQNYNSRWRQLRSWIFAQHQ